MTDLDYIGEIAKRAACLANDHGRQIDRIDLFLALAGAHRVCPLALDKLLEADDLDFVHDVFGCHQYYNPSCRQLDVRFIPKHRR